MVLVEAGRVTGVVLVRRTACVVAICWALGGGAPRVRLQEAEAKTAERGCERSCERLREGAVTGRATAADAGPVLAAAALRCWVARTRRTTLLTGDPALAGGLAVQLRRAGLPTEGTSGSRREWVPVPL